MSKLGGESRRCKAVRDWSLNVRERDGKCMNCGTVEDLQSHHIIPWNSDKTQRLNIDNGITYCRKCHNSIEKKGFIPWISGKKHTKESKEKMRKAKIGHIPWNKGVKNEIPLNKICTRCEVDKEIECFTPLQGGKWISNICKMCRNKNLSNKRYNDNKQCNQ